MTVFSFTVRGQLVMGEVMKLPPEEGDTEIRWVAASALFPEYKGVSATMPGAVDNLREGLLERPTPKDRNNDDHTTDDQPGP